MQKRSLLSASLFCWCCLTAKAQVNDSLKNQLLHTFYQYRLTYPHEALEAGIEGDIHLKFDISPHCEVINVRQDTVLGHGTELTVNESLDLLEKEWSTQHKGNCQEVRDVDVLVNFRLQ